MGRDGRAADELVSGERVVSNPDTPHRRCDQRSGSTPHNAPKKTPAFWAIADAARAPEDSELNDVIDAMGRPSASGGTERPDALTIDGVSMSAQGDLTVWLRDRKNRRVIPHRLEKCGYVAVRNEAADDGCGG
jgi:hypothetical protein